MNDKELYAFMIKHYQIINYELDNRKRTKLESCTKASDDVGDNNSQFIKTEIVNILSIDEVKANLSNLNKVVSNKFDHTHRLSTDESYYVFTTKTGWDAFLENKNLKLTYDVCKYLYSINISIGDFYETEYLSEKYPICRSINGLKAFRNKPIKDNYELELIYKDKKLLNLFFTYDFYKADVVNYVINKFFINYKLKDWYDTLKILSHNSYSYNYVDLGLNVLWATCNLGANKETDEGLNYIWGEPFHSKSPDKEIFYKQAWLEDLPVATFIEYGKYREHYVDIARSRFDAVYMNLGGNWRLPQREDFIELLNKCKWEEIINQKGKKIGNKIIGPNGNSIFLPYTKNNRYLTSNRGTSYPYSYMLWHTSYKRYVDRLFSYELAVIRPVCDKNDPYNL